MEENFAEMNYEDSTSTKLSDILPKSGKRLRFEYEYDFGDCWQHEVLFEGCVRAERAKGYPLCLEGARACPPEDVGGTWGYEEYLEAMADPEHERHEECMGWRGAFDREAFDPVKATKGMKRGLPDWRSSRWI
jgi:Plasmid pRiA4b ORF-3-like protein